MILALLVGLGVFLVSLLFFVMATALVVPLVVRLIRLGYAGPRFWPNVAVMIIVSLVMAAMHLVQITLWAVAFQMCGATSSFEKAIYWSAGNYTTLGYGDVVVPERWRLLGPLEAINGFLLFGLSTAVMFAVMSRLIVTRLHLQPSGLDEEAGTPGPRSVVSDIRGDNV
jgi:hypothetical protein